jgi:deoxycytidylate deaminase
MQNWTPWIRLALKQSLTSPHDRYHVAAVAIRGGNVLSMATNGSPSSHGLYKTSLHAEARCLRRGANYSGAVLIIVREGSRMSRPCNACMIKIKSANIKKIVYLSWTADVQVENIQ